MKHSKSDRRDVSSATERRRRGSERTDFAELNSRATDRIMHSSTEIGTYHSKVVLFSSVAPLTQVRETTGFRSLERSMPHIKIAVRNAVIFVVFLSASLVMGCMSDAELNRDVKLEYCVIPMASLEAAVENWPERTEQYYAYASGFLFNGNRQCYGQRWEIPRQVFQTKTESSPGEDQVRIQFPYTNKAGEQPSGWVKELAGINVLIRPIGTFLNFASKSEFREARLGKPTGQYFQGFAVHLEASTKQDNRMRVLVGREPRDLFITLGLSPGASSVSEANVESLITVFTHLDDRFELRYRLVPTQLNEISSIDSQIKNNIRSYLKD